MANSFTLRVTPMNSTIRSQNYLCFSRRLCNRWRGRSAPVKSLASKPMRRSAAAVVELAVCLPVILLVVMGTIESANMLFMRQALVQSSYEAAKVAIHRRGTNATAINAANNVADGRRISNIQIEFEPANVASVARGELIRVTVSAPGNSNSIFNFPPFNGTTITGTAAMVKE